MKSHLKIVVSLFLLLSGTMLFSQSKKWTPSEFLSPDEGAIIYGVGSLLNGAGNDTGASQINFDKEPAFLLPQIKTKMIADYFCFAPVEKGTRWIFFSRYDDTQKLSSKEVHTRLTARHKVLGAVANPFIKDFQGEGLSEQGAKYAILDVPENKKIVFWNYWGVSPDDYTEEKDIQRMKKWYWESRKEALDYVKTKYKGTEWEAVIAEEYEYVNKEYENVK